MKTIYFIIAVTTFVILLNYIVKKFFIIKKDMKSKNKGCHLNDIMGYDFIKIINSKEIINDTINKKSLEEQVKKFNQKHHKNIENKTCNNNNTYYPSNEDIEAITNLQNDNNDYTDHLKISSNKEKFEKDNDSTNIPTQKEVEEQNLEKYRQENLEYLLTESENNPNVIGITSKIQETIQKTKK